MSPEELDLMCAKARERLAHSIATRAGIHKARIRQRVRELMLAHGAVPPPVGHRQDDPLQGEIT